MTDSMAARLERALTDSEQLQVQNQVLEGTLREIVRRAHLRLLRGENAALDLAVDAPMAARLEALLPRASGVSTTAGRAEEELNRAATAIADAIIAAPEDEERQEAAACAAACAIATVPRLTRKGNRGKVPSVWTDARLRMLDAEGHAMGERGQDLLARVNALPGPPCASVNSMRGKYRLRLDAGLIAPPKPAAPKAAPAKPAAAKPAHAKPSTIPEDDKAEARQMIQQGRGALHLSRWFGWDLEEAQDFTAAVRAETE